MRERRSVSRQRAMLQQTRVPILPQQKQACPVRCVRTTLTEFLDPELDEELDEELDDPSNSRACE
jgi:hypothetical protein